MVSPSLLTIGIEALTTLVFDVFQEKGKDLIDKVDVDLHLPTPNKEIEKYVYEYLKRHGQIKILNMRKPVSLEKIYTDIELLSGSQDATGFESTEELNEKFLRVGDLLSINRDKYDRTPALEFVQRESRLVILGGPGAGKSTLLKKVGVEAWKQSKLDKKGKQLLPVFIDLKRFSRQQEININLKEEIIKEVRICGIKTNTEKIIQTFLDKGRLLILLDGLDELLQEKRIEAIDAIQNFSDEYYENSFLVSCRLAAYQSKRLGNFQDVEIAVFKESQIRETILRWFSEQDENIGNDCFQKINLPKNSSVKKLADTPLLLTLICIFYQQTGRFPINRSILYEKAIETLLEGWNASKGFLDRYESLLDNRQKEVLLETIAYEAFEEGNLFMYQRWMSRRVEETLHDMDIDLNIKGKTIIENIELDNGLIIRQTDQHYSFSHDTIQEFFSASYITKKFSRIEKAVNLYLLEERWQGVFIFLSGLRQSEDVLDAIEKKSQKYIKVPPLQWLLRWVSKSTIDVSKNGTNSSEKLDPVVRRIFAIYIALCFHLYFSETDQRFQGNLSAIRMCQNLMREFRSDIPKSSLRNIREFEKLIAVLITARQNTNAYQASSKSISGKKVKIRNMKKQILLIRRQCKNAIDFLNKNYIFGDIDTKSLSENCDEISRKILEMEKSPENYLLFCNQISMQWLTSLSLDLKEMKKLNSNSTEALATHFYCLTILKKCSETAKRFSKGNWRKIQNKMLFARWITS